MTLHDERADWESISRGMGLISPDGERWTTRDAQRAAATLLGESVLRDAVDWCVDLRRGSGLAEGVLRLLQPDAARLRCLEIYRTSSDAGRRGDAIRTFRVIATGDDLPLAEECLADSGEAVQTWGIGIVEWLPWGGEIDHDDAEPYLQAGERHHNPYVREKCAAIRAYIQSSHGGSDQ